MNAPNPVLARDEVQIRTNLLQMAELARNALDQAMVSLEAQAAEVAQAVVDADATLNTLRRLVERECLQVLALQQPVARDLREIIASLQIAGELERIGDHAKDVAKIVLGMDAGDFSGPMDRIAEMAALCNEMLERVMEAYINRDEDQACSAAEQDRQLDDLDQEAVASLMMRLMSAPDTGMHATHLLWIAYHLERVGDRVANIAERVVFMVSADTPELS